jgi:dTDP-4-amino-4,6-dideoxygalactose transaminase
MASIYHSRLSHIEDLLLPPSPSLNDEHFDIYQNYEIESSNRDNLRDYLANNGVKTIIQWGGKCLHQFSELNLLSDAAYTEEMTRRFFMLPMNTSLSDDDVHYVCDVIEKFYKNYAEGVI